MTHLLIFLLGVVAAGGDVGLRLQMLVAEAGLGRQADHPAMLHAIPRLAARRRLSVQDTIRRDVTEFRYGWRPGREWIGGLTPACSEPAQWPQRLNWAGGNQHGCIRLVAMVRAHDRGKLKDPCKGRPLQWRSRKAKKAIRLARRRGWRRIGCGRDSLHVFYEVPK